MHYCTAVRWARRLSNLQKGDKYNTKLKYAYDDL